MTREEINSILFKILEPEEAQLDSPSNKDWDILSDKFKCEFSDDFKFFIDLMSKYMFPGDIYNVATGKNNGNDSINFVYDYEMNSGDWDKDFIPFYGIGNGDYFCLNIKECPQSKVYYFYHEDLRIEVYSDSFEMWIKDLPNFLG